LLPNDQLRFLQGPIICFLGTRDRALRPGVAWASAVRADGVAGTITFLLPDAESARPLADIEDNGLIALTALDPLSHQSYQYKGRFLSQRPGNDDDRALCDIQRSKACARVDELRLPGHLFARYVFWPGTAITFRVEEIYDQTPGPNAGRQIALAEAGT
jgi:hypothetical protein